MRVLDPFHVVRLGLAARRRRPPPRPAGPPGTAAAPATRSTASAGCCAAAPTGSRTKARARLEAGLIAGDPDGEVTLAWTVAQDLMALYRHDDPDQARAAGRAS